MRSSRPKVRRVLPQTSSIFFRKKSFFGGGGGWGSFASVPPILPASIMSYVYVAKKVFDFDLFNKKNPFVLGFAISSTNKSECHGLLMFATGAFHQERPGSRI